MSALEKLEEINRDLEEAVKLIRGASIKANVLSGEMLKKGERDLSVELKLLKEAVDKMLVEMGDGIRDCDMWIRSIRRKLEEVSL